MREMIIEVAQSLPNNITFDDFLEALYLRVKVEKSLKNIEDEEVISSKDLLKEIEAWIYNKIQ